MQDHRSITDILHFRSDISPFLVHLTRDNEDISAKEVLHTIIREKQLKSGKNPVSDARFGRRISDDERLKYFGAVCFTETPLNEVHCLFNIAYRQINLKPYGLVFLKHKLKEKGVSPVLYINNEEGDKLDCIKALCSLIETHPEEAQQILPLISVFGKKFYPINNEDRVDFLWEREWRYPYSRGPFQINADDVFIGLCPHEEINEFEKLFGEIFSEKVPFIDPMRNMKWYATKLIAARQRVDLKFSVV